jgi:hypothetical protein
MTTPISTVGIAGQAERDAEREQIGQSVEQNAAGLRQMAGHRRHAPVLPGQSAQTEEDGCCRQRHHREHERPTELLQIADKLHAFSSCAT